MANKKIVITIENGKISSEVFGAVGKECDSIDSFIKNIGKVKSHNKKPEYFNKNKNGAKAYDKTNG